MDTTTLVMMHIIEDYYAGDERPFTKAYTTYYDTLSMSGAKEVVKSALNKMVQEDPNVKYTLNDDTFTLTLPED